MSRAPGTRVCALVAALTLPGACSRGSHGGAASPPARPANAASTAGTTNAPTGAGATRSATATATTRATTGATAAGDELEARVAGDLHRVFELDTNAGRMLCAAQVEALTDIEVRDVQPAGEGQYRAEVIASPAPVEGQDLAAPAQRCRARVLFQWERGAPGQDGGARGIQVTERLAAPPALH